MPVSNSRIVERNVAVAATAGSWQINDIVARLRQAIGRVRGLTELARRLVAVFHERPDVEQLLPILRADPLYSKLPKLVRTVFWSTPVMGAGHGWAAPTIRTTTELATRLELSPGELDWFADVQGRNSRQHITRLQHYTHRWIAKRGGRYRLLEVPKSRLKEIQRIILRDILAHIPPHDAAHGFRAGRSVRTFAEPHTNRLAVLRIDLKDFFPAVRASRVHAIFCSAGYPITVARTLTGLCTTALPVGVAAPNPDVPLSAFRQRHLPQGAPTSPALANLAAFGLDVRLSAWASACGAVYTRYADDLAFSGDESFARVGIRFRRMVWQIIAEEGFRANAVKSRWMTAGGRQHLAGVVVNKKPNIRRDEFDRLKAMLTNCIRHGPAGQNREGHPDFRAHLLGRIAHVAMLNAERGARLRILAERIDWSR